LYCKYCGKESWLTRLTGDPDFCTPRHRKKFHQHLRTVLKAMEAENIRVPQSPGPMALLPPISGFDEFFPTTVVAPIHGFKPARYSRLSFERLSEPLEPQSFEMTNEVSAAYEPVERPVPVMDATPAPPTPVIPISRSLQEDPRLRRIAEVIASLRARHEFKEAAGL
jgi:hypothetical protein